MNKKKIIKKTELFAKETLSKDSTDHDWWHIHRVRNLAKRIARHEDADIFIVELAVLLHDIGDYKYFQGDRLYHRQNFSIKWSCLFYYFLILYRY